MPTRMGRGEAGPPNTDSAPDEGLLQVLMHAKADVDKPTADDGRTPAFVAARNGHAESLRVLLQAAAEVTRCLDGSGWSPLLAASDAGHLEVVRLLLDRAPQMVHVRTTAEHEWWGRYIAAGSAPTDVARQLRVVQSLLSAKLAGAGEQPKRPRTYAFKVLRRVALPLQLLSVKLAGAQEQPKRPRKCAFKVLRRVVLPVRLLSVKISGAGEQPKRLQKYAFKVLRRVVPRH